jgi:hypothetical protein
MLNFKAQMPNQILSFNDKFDVWILKLIKLFYGKN